MRTDNTGNAVVPRYSLFVIALPTFKCLREIHCRLDRFSLKIKLVNATLRDHLKVAFAVPSVYEEEKVEDAYLA